MLKSCQIRTWSCSNAFFEHSEKLQVLMWHDLRNLEWKKKSKFKIPLSVWGNDKPINPFWIKATFTTFYEKTVLRELLCYGVDSYEERQTTQAFNFKDMYSVDCQWVDSYPFTELLSTLLLSCSIPFYWVAPYA